MTKPLRKADLDASMSWYVDSVRTLCVSGLGTGKELKIDLVWSFSSKLSSIDVWQLQKLIDRLIQVTFDTCPISKV